MAIIRSFLALSLLLVFSLAASAQTRVYRTPRAVSFENVARKTFPKYYGPEAYQKLEVAGFYPIGWSRDGKFAYYVEPVDEACGCYFAELYILDLKTDKELWKFKNDPESRVDANGAPLDDNLQKLWKRNQRLFNKKLSEYGIVPITRFASLGNNFSSGGRSYSVKLIAPKEHDDEFGYDHVRSVNLALSSPALGTKTVYSADEKGERFLSPLDVAVAGVLKSPFENRMAIVMMSVHRGWEGPPHTVGFQAAGADLVSGFKK
ncbi:MAG TPA: hypothetical protein VJL58_00395 [Pyrinomonadaceae bacterium]|nr:hypothetical protein [Pyrinomonadaceae bacterium]